MNTATQRKQPVKRAFEGMAGSPLAKVKKALEGVSSSDHTLRVAKSPDREEPIGFNEWWDAFGQRHAQIDEDCEFQSYAFDRQLRAANPLDAVRDSESVGDPDSQTHGTISVLDDLCVDPDAPKHKRKGVQFGLLDGERLIKRRRATDKTWWIFESNLLREFLRAKYDEGEKGADSAKNAALVIYHYYFRNRLDEEIFEETSLFKDAKSLKNFRQRIVAEGSEQYPVSERPERSTNGRRGRIRGNKPCDDPNCPCHTNDRSFDFTGIET